MTASVRALAWPTNVKRPSCPVRGCENPAAWVVRFKVERRGRFFSRRLWRCNVHARSFSDTHDLQFPPTGGESE